MRTFSLILVLFIYYTRCHGQNTFENDLVVYKDSIGNSIEKLIKKEFITKGPDTNGISIEALAYCFFEPTMENNEDLTAFSITIDTSFKMATKSFNKTNELVFWNRTLFSFPITRRAGDSNFTGIEYPDQTYIKSFYEIEMINTARKYSQSYFFLHFLDRGAEGSVPLAFIDRGVIRVIDRDLKIYSTIREFVEKEFGCVDKYLEMWRDDKVRKEQSRRITVDVAKSIYRNEFSLWWRHFPNDTVGVVNLFLNQMDSLVHLRGGQRKLLELKIKENIDQYHPCVSGLLLFGKEITPLISGVLTYGQLVRYNQGRSDIIWLLGRATNKLDEYYIVERKIPIEKEDEIIKKEVFYPN